MKVPTKEKERGSEAHDFLDTPKEGGEKKDRIRAQLRDLHGTNPREGKV